MPKNIAIILSAGSGTRMGKNLPKQFLPLNNKPIICHTIEKFQNCIEIDEIIIVMGETYIDFFESEILKKYTYSKIKKVVTGGKERVFSAYEGLKAIEETDSIVLIHDSVRPFVKIAHIKKIIDNTLKFDACILAVKAKETIKICKNGFIKYTPPRENLWVAQTPQGFNYNLIKNAYEKTIEENLNVTDDASIVENLGINVKVISGDYENIKITTLDDLQIGEYFLNSKVNIN